MSWKPVVKLRRADIGLSTGLCIGLEFPAARDGIITLVPRREAEGISRPRDLAVAVVVRQR